MVYVQFRVYEADDFDPGAWQQVVDQNDEVVVYQ